MGLSLQWIEDEKELHLKILGRLELHDHSAFREAYLSRDAGHVAFVIDMADTEFIDSATLGMFLAMREDLGGDNANITLANCNEQISRLLRATNLSKVFTVR